MILNYLEACYGIKGITIEYKDLYRLAVWISFLFLQQISNEYAE
jgi:hypothetical protein